MEHIVEQDLELQAVIGFQGKSRTLFYFIWRAGWLECYLVALANREVGFVVLQILELAELLFKNCTHLILI